MNLVKELAKRSAVTNTPEATPVCADFPDPEQRAGRRPLRLVGAGLHHVVRAVVVPD
jgi:hypothetical protein